MHRVIKQYSFLIMDITFDNLPAAVSEILAELQSLKSLITGQPSEPKEKDRDRNTQRSRKTYFHNKKKTESW